MIYDGVSRCRERKALADHLIAASYAQHHQAQMQGSSAGTKGYDPLALNLEIAFEVSLEAVYVRPQRHYPIRVESLLYKSLLLAAHLSQR